MSRLHTTLKSMKEVGIALGVIFIWWPLFLLWCAWDWAKRRFIEVVKEIK